MDGGTACDAMYPLKDTDQGKRASDIKAAAGNKTQ